MKEVFKFQRPITCSPGGESTIMVYNQERTVNFMTDMDESQIDDLFGDEYKVFYEAEIDPEGQLVISDQVPGWDGDAPRIHFHNTSTGQVDQYSIGLA